MELMISKIEESGKLQLNIKFLTAKGEENFDYIKLIDTLYHKPQEEIKFSFSDTVSDEEKIKIQELFDEIKKISSTVEKTDKSPQE